MSGTRDYKSMVSTHRIGKTIGVDGDKRKLTLKNIYNVHISKLFVYDAVM